MRVDGPLAPGSTRRCVWSAQSGAARWGGAHAASKPTFRPLGQSKLATRHRQLNAERSKKARVISRCLGCPAALGFACPAKQHENFRPAWPMPNNRPFVLTEHGCEVGDNERKNGMITSTLALPTSQLASSARGLGCHCLFPNLLNFGCHVCPSAPPSLRCIGAVAVAHQPSSLTPDPFSGSDSLCCSRPTMSSLRVGYRLAPLDREFAGFPQSIRCFNLLSNNPDADAPNQAIVNRPAIDGP